MTNHEGIEVEVGDWVAGGKTAEDRDFGRVVRVDGDTAVVGWIGGANQTPVGPEIDVYASREAAASAAVAS